MIPSKSTRRPWEFQGLVHDLIFFLQVTLQDEFDKHDLAIYRIVSICRNAAHSTRFACQTVSFTAQHHMQCKLILTKSNTKKLFLRLLMEDGSEANTNHDFANAFFCCL